MMKGLIYIVCMVLLFIIWPVKTFAQNFPKLRFDHLTVKDGLSNSVTKCAGMDINGFMWIGTENGLNRYDGYRLKKYFHNTNDSNSLINNSIQSLYCDKKGRIWISTDGGVSCFLPDKNYFINYSVNSPGGRNLLNNSAAVIFEDERGIVWLLNQGNSILMVKNDMTLQELQLTIPAFTFQGSQKKGYTGVYIDKKGDEWAYCASRIYLLNKSNKQVQKIFDFSEKLNTEIVKIAEDESGNFWVGTWGDGLMKFISGTNTLKRIKSVQGESVIDVMPWFYENKNWILVVDAYNGVSIIDTEKETSSLVKANNNDPHSIANGDIYSLFSDPSGSLWITHDKGVDILNSGGKVFKVYPITDPGLPDFDPGQNTMVMSFYEDEENYTWITKRYRSTSIYDSNMQLKKFIPAHSPFNSDAYGASYYNYRIGPPYFFYPKEKELYISTDSGLAVYQKQAEKSVLFFPKEFSGTADFREMFPLYKDLLLIRSYRNGLFLFNSATKKFIKYYSNKTGCVPSLINYLFKSSGGQIFITGNSGNNFLKYNEVKDTFINVTALGSAGFAMSKLNLYNIAEDRKGRLWIASSDGVFVYNTGTNMIETHFNENGKMGWVRRICFDKAGNTWTFGNSCIWFYSVMEKKWINYTTSDGLPDGNTGALLGMKKNGNIVAGFEGSMAVFNPDEMLHQRKYPPVIITEATVDSNFSYFPLRNDAQKIITVSARQSYFSVDFAVLNYSSPASTRYYYKLAPLMNNFQLNDNGHINFNGLAPGHYTLYVKGGDKAGNIFDKEDILDITVEPKWYQTNWFKALCLFAVLALVIGIYKWRVNTIRKQAGFKQKMAETEMQALRGQMNPHFIFNSLNSIENFIMQNEKRLASDYLNKFSRLIRSILDSSRNEVVPLAKDMEALQLYVELEQLRFNNKFSYHTHVDPVLLQGDYRVPSLLIQPYVENAIVHGISHSHKKDLQLTVTAVLESDTIRYTVQDNGVGRKQSDEYNLQNKPKHKSIGLKITEDRINIFNRQAIGTNIVKFTDLYDASNNPAGTKVDITINTLINE
jgi:ligand-binding sensor domain-containing protein